MINTILSKNKPQQRILVANRGEIALRILRTLKKEKIKGILAYTNEDKYSYAVREFDESHEQINSTYMCMDSILNLAKKVNADGIHPGYGFLSENAKFAELCEKENIYFIGSPSNILYKVGSKINAKNIAINAGITCLPSLSIPIDTIIVSNSFLQHIDSIIGYPLLVKADYGGGGRAMRVVHYSSELQEAITSLQIESNNLFGTSKLLIEKYIINGQHLEVQIAGDMYGSCIHMYERDCTIQRRRQKIIEYSPAKITQELRERLQDSAILIGKECCFQGVGTVEFLYDKTNDILYFLEVNPRLQVEHGVTELVTNIDIVALQLHLAVGKPLPFVQKDVKFKGNAIECRIYAETVKDGIWKSESGKIEWYKQPTNSKSNVQIDTSVQINDTISSQYDNLIAKVIVNDDKWEECITKMIEALKSYHIYGCKTNIFILCQQFRNFDKISWNTSILDDSKFLSNMLQPILDISNTGREKAIILAGCSVTYLQSYLGFRLNDPPINIFCYLEQEANNGKTLCIDWIQLEKNIKGGISGKCIINNKGNTINKDILNYNTSVELIDNKYYKIICYINSDRYEFNVIKIEKPNYHINKLNIFDIYYNIQYNIKLHPSEIALQIDTTDVKADNEIRDTETIIKTSIGGRLLRVLVNINDILYKNQPLFIIESMKMEHTICSPCIGIVESIFEKPGAILIDHQPVIRIIPGTADISKT